VASFLEKSVVLSIIYSNRECKKPELKPQTVMGNLKKLQNGKQNNFRTYIEIYEIVDGN